MRSTFYLALSTIATLVVADKPNAFNIPNGGYEFTAGEPTTLKWSPSSDSTVSLRLQSGDVLTPDGGSTIASKIDNSGSFTWTPPKDIADESDYTIEIVDDDDADETNYLPRFSVSGATGTAGSGDSSSTSSSGSSSSAGASSADASTTASDASTTASDATSTATGASATKTSDSSASASSTGASASSSSGSSSSSASASNADAAASSTGAQSASETGSDTSAGVVNRASGGLLALALGVVALM